MMAIKEIALGGKNGTGKVALVDAEDYELVSRFPWNLHPKGYVVAGINDYELTGAHSQFTISMHRLIMGCKRSDGKTVDHINHDPLDNRRANLRIVTPGESLRNRRAFKGIGTGYKGVRKRKDTYCAFIDLGGFDTAEEAAQAYDNAIRKVFPGFPVNFPQKGEISALCEK